MGFPRQECYSGLPLPTPRDLPNPGIEPTSLASPALAGGFFTTSTTWEAPGTVTKKKKKFKVRGEEFAPPYIILVGKFALADHDSVGIYQAIKDSDSGKGLSARLSLMPRTLTCFEKRFLNKTFISCIF